MVWGGAVDTELGGTGRSRDDLQHSSARHHENGLEADRWKEEGQPRGRASCFRRAGWAGRFRFEKTWKWRPLMIQRQTRQTVAGKESTIGGGSGVAKND
jgi:hypothetical protein